MGRILFIKDSSTPSRKGVQASYTGMVQELFLKTQNYQTKKRKVSLALLPNKNQVGHKKKVQVPKMEVLTYKSCMDTAYVRETHPQNSLK